MSDKELSGDELGNATTERVMGWHVEQFMYGEVPFWNWVDASGARSKHLDDWDPESCVDHAIEVVLKMQEKGWESRIGTHSYGPRWTVEMFHANGNSMRRETASSDSLPEAICRAALAAIENQE